LRHVPQAIVRLLHGGDVIDSYRVQWQSFADAIRNTTPIKPGLEDGRTALQIALAAAQSARSGRSVRVDEATDPIVSLTAVSPGASTVG
jgi:predicted dehydrogenase